MMEASFQKIIQDLASWRDLVPGLLHPIRALALARAVSSVSAARIAEKMGISRSYLAALENYTKPITDDFYNYIDKLTAKEGNNFSTAYNNFTPDIGVEALFQYVYSLEKTIHRELEDQLLHLIFEAVTAFPHLFDILWEEVPGGQEGYFYLVDKEKIKWPSWWPAGQIPKAILTSSRQSWLLSWLAGQISSDELVSYYEGKPVGVNVLIHRQQRGEIKPSGLIALSIFLFSQINISFSHNMSYPVQCSSIFQGYVLSNLFDPLTTWFNIEELVPSKFLAKKEL